MKAFSFNDDTFTMNQPYMKEFLVRYKKEIGTPFVCNTTVLDVDREMLEVMKDSNCDLVRFGVETATTRIKRRVLKRDFSNKKTEQVFKRCHEIGLRTFAFNILANPTETREEMRDTLQLNSKLLPNGLKMSLGYPFPGTEYHDIAKELDLIDETKHLHNFIHDTKLKWRRTRPAVDRQGPLRVLVVDERLPRERGLAALQRARQARRVDSPRRVARPGDGAPHVGARRRALERREGARHHALHDSLQGSAGDWHPLHGHRSP